MHHQGRLGYTKAQFLYTHDTNGLGLLRGDCRIDELYTVRHLSMESRLLINIYTWELVLYILSASSLPSEILIITRRFYL